MAKWGEGDPRWIVEERPDATNVNNWHWTEKNATFWSRERFFVLFKNCRMEFLNAYAEIVDVQINDGEASANNRKGKLFFFYDWSLTLKWEGRILNGSGSKIDGKLNIPNLSDEHNANEIDIITELNESTDEGEMLKQMIHVSGRDKIREVIQTYINELKEEFSKGLILPMKNSQSINVSNVSSGYNRNGSEKEGTGTGTEKKTAAVKKPSVVKTATTDSTVKTNTAIELVTLKSIERFKCDTEYLFRILTSREMTEAYTRGSIEFEACENGRFSLFGGNITGHFEKITPNVEIVQKWRYKAWPSNVYSTVTMRFVDKGDEVELQVEQKGVPKSDSQNTANNWTKFYWNAIRSTFGLIVNIHHQ